MRRDRQIQEFRQVRFDCVVFFAPAAMVTRRKQPFEQRKIPLRQRMSTTRDPPCSSHRTEPGPRAVSLRAQRLLVLLVPIFSCGSQTSSYWSPSQMLDG